MVPEKKLNFIQVRYITYLVTDFVSGVIALDLNIVWNKQADFLRNLKSVTDFLVLES